MECCTKTKIKNLRKTTLKRKECKNIMKNLKKYLNKKTLGLIAYVIIIMFIASFIIGFMEKDNKSFLGYTARIVVTGSMEPEIKTNSITVIKMCNVDEIEKDDIICYNYGQDIVHRVVEKTTNENNSVVLHTQGDNNKAPDNVDINSDMIVGKVVKTVNWVAPFIDKYSIEPGKIDGVTLARNLVIYGIILGLVVVFVIWVAHNLRIFSKSFDHNLSFEKTINKYIADIDELIMYKDLLLDLKKEETDIQKLNQLDKIAQAKADLNVKELHIAIKEFKRSVRHSIFLKELGAQLEEKNRAEQRVKNTQLQRVVNYCKRFSKQA